MHIHEKATQHKSIKCFRQTFLTLPIKTFDMLLGKVKYSQWL